MPFWTVVEPVLSCAFLLAAGLALPFVRPSNVEKYLLQPPSRSNFLATFRCSSVQTPFSPSFVTRPRQAAAKHPPSILPIHALLPTLDYRGLLQQHFLNIFWADTPHVNLDFAFKSGGLPMRSLCTQITGLTHYRSCRSSNLPPRLNFLNLMHPRFISPSRLLLPSTGWPK